jgi:hypothetical protein
MARKSRRRRHRKTADEEWKDWGEKFGKRMEKRGKDFGEEIGQLGEKFGRHMERRGKEYKSRWFRSFGVVGPLIGSIFGIIVLAVGIFVLNFVNLALGSAFISAISSFLFANIYLFFAIFLFGNYRDYFSRRYENFWVVSPITTGISIIIALWIFAWLINLVNTVPQTQVLTSVSSFLLSNLSSFLAIFIVLGYAIVIIKKMIGRMWRY